MYGGVLLLRVATNNPYVKLLRQTLKLDQRFRVAGLGLLKLC